MFSVFKTYLPIFFPDFISCKALNMNSFQANINDFYSFYFSGFSGSIHRFHRVYKWYNIKMVWIP